MVAREALRRLEGSLSAAETVVAWARAVAAFGSLERYQLAMIDDASAALGFATVAERSLAAKLAAVRHLPPDDRLAAHRSHRRDLELCHAVVMTLEAVRDSTAAELGPVADRLDGGADRAFPTDRGPIDEAAARRWLEDVAAVVRRAAVVDEAVYALEARHLEGHAAGFPDTRERWVRLRRHLADCRTLAEALLEQELPGVEPPTWHADPAEVGRWTLGLERSVRIRAHLALGERDVARDRLARWATEDRRRAAPATADEGPAGEDLRFPAT